jgi:hypothetical protein
MGELIGRAARPAVADWGDRARARPSYARAVLRYMAVPGRAAAR